MTAHARSVYMVIEDAEDPGRRLFVPSKNNLGPPVEGLSFTINSKVVDVVRELERQGARVDIYDPWADARECRHEYGLKLLQTLKSKHYDAAVLAVPHREFRELKVRGVRRLLKKSHVIYDVKHLFPASQVDGRL